MREGISVRTFLLKEISVRTFFLRRFSVNTPTTPVAIERVRKELIPKELHCSRGVEECARL
jgi:hypothetical protein